MMCFIIRNLLLTTVHGLTVSDSDFKKINLLLAVIFAMVMFLILALDRPETGLAKLNQRPILTLQQQLHGKY